MDRLAVKKSEKGDSRGLLRNLAVSASYGVKNTRVAVKVILE